MLSTKVRQWVSSDVGLLMILALARMALHTLVNNQYGFHRDELLTFDNARHLAWGYVVYPPITPFLARVELELFGNSLRGFRFFAAVSQGLLMFITGLIARELGARRQGQFAAACAVGISGYSLFSGSFLSYSTFDYLWWPMVAYFVVRLLKSGDSRWCLAIGATVGVGIMTKYTMCFLVLGLLGGVLLTPARRFLKSPWLYLGVFVSVLIVLPNFLWQISHDFISLDFLRSIHAHDIRWGWTDYFLPNQLVRNINFVTIPLFFAGLWFVFTSDGRRYRLLGWMYVIPLVAFLLARGRDYYLAPAYPALLATGTVWAERKLQSLSTRSASTVWQIVWPTFAIAGLCAASLTIPVAPINSTWWHVANGVNGNFHYEVGWQDLAATVAKVRDSLPPQDRSRLAVLAADDGQAGAVNLYGPAFGLPAAISGMNSNWLRGYGDPPPETVITVGFKHEMLLQNFESCQLADHLSNPYGIDNRAIDGYNEVYVCRSLRWPWPVFWEHFRYFG